MAKQIFPFTIYRMSLPSTGQYYIGVTNNFILRQKAHRMAIQTLFWGIKSKSEEKPKLKCHLIIAQHLVKGKRKDRILKYKREIISQVQFEVLCGAKTIQAACAAENKWIAASAGDTLCLNERQNSGYKTIKQYPKQSVALTDAHAEMQP